jgi:hypothetical protein
MTADHARYPKPIIVGRLGRDERAQPINVDR